MARNSRIMPTAIVYNGFLVIDERGGMKLSRSEPTLNPGERSIDLKVQVPRKVFRTPALSANVTVPDVLPTSIQVPVTASLSEEVTA